MDIERIDPAQARARLASGSLLVCAYEPDEKFRKNHLEGAISLQDLEAREDRLTKDHEIIFYCR